ncbi:hypothetical protein [Streptomyces sp. CA-111067]|uniref:hypothetical protein n=1 Tax=Streptomyces sp. CA-111067 TaxID=3240046 RepID=UPI003D958E02
MDTNAAAEPRTRHRALLWRIAGTAAAAGLVAVVVTYGGSSGAKSSPDSVPLAAAPAAGDSPGFAVEDYNYPGADAILAAQGITLKRGDGHIILADCAGSGELLEIKSGQTAGDICFSVIGSSGWLTMEIPDVFTIKGNDYTTQVDMTAGTEHRTYDITKNLWTGVGQGGGESDSYALVEIRTSR